MHPSQSRQHIPQQAISAREFARKSMLLCQGMLWQILGRIVFARESAGESGLGSRAKLQQVLDASWALPGVA